MEERGNETIMGGMDGADCSILGWLISMLFID